LKEEIGVEAAWESLLYEDGCRKKERKESKKEEAELLNRALNFLL
jgi:hypothetical protein